MEQNKKFISVSALSEYLGVPQSQIRSMVKRGSIPYTRLGGRIMFDFELVMAWLDKHTVLPK